jgi:ribosome-binding protein aMBF1 (putative translation factor)
MAFGSGCSHDGTIVPSLVKAFLLYLLGVSPGELEQICANVARILREERENRKISMTELAVRAGLSRTMIRFVEREIRNPSLETLLRMANALQVNLADVIQRAIETPKKR